MLRFRVRNERQQTEFEHASGPIEFGRGAAQNGVPRCIIQDLYVSGNHASIVEVDGGRVQVTNLSARNNIRLASDVVAVGTTRVLDTPVRLTVGETTVDIETVAPGVVDPPEEDPPYEEGAETADIEAPLHTVAAAPVSPRTMLAAPAQSLSDLGGAPSPEKLAQWFETVIAVQRKAAGSPEFFQDTARAIVALVGLDKGLVLLKRNGRWMVQARCPDDDGGMSRGREFSMTIAARVEKERRTFYQSEGTSAAQAAESLQGVEAVVASPVFDSRDQVIGMVYGSRTKYSRQRGGVGIGALEAQVMQLLAAAVGAGLARQEQEAEAGRLRVQFEQFFSADLARELQRNPNLLKGQEREVTVLFGDIRSFSTISEKLGPAATCDLVGAVMDRMTQRIMEHEGVVVDYAGDGIMAIWNAPTTVADHASKAVRASLACLGDLAPLGAEWKDKLPPNLTLKVGIGLNTGPAMCGNTGCSARFKYGPLGNTVNLASRVEGATKQLGMPLLITGSTREKLGEGFETRRLCRVRVVNIKEPVDLYEVKAADAAAAEWKSFRDTYERALKLYEDMDFRGACRALYGTLTPEDEVHDLPSLNLSARAIDALRSPPDREKFGHGVIDLLSK